MEINYRPRELTVYDIALQGTYYPGLAVTLTDVMEGLRTALARLLGHADTMNAQELAVVAEQLTSFEQLIAGFRDRHPAMAAAQPLPPTQPDNAGEQAKEEPGEDLHHDSTPEDAADREPELSSDGVEAEWQSIQPELQLPYPLVTSEAAPWEHELVAGLTGVLQAAGASQERKRAFRQIHLVEAHLLLMHLLGVEHVDPKNDLTGFARLANDAHALRILSRPSEHFLKEPIRGYRNAEQNGKVMAAVKVPNEMDPSKVTDYFSFLPERGAAYALRELKEVGLRGDGELQFLAAQLEQHHPLEVEQLRRASRRVAETVRALPT